jgi:hypothetical protein
MRISYPACGLIVSAKGETSVSFGSEAISAQGKPKGFPLIFVSFFKLTPDPIILFLNYFFVKITSYIFPSAGHKKSRSNAEL